MQVSHDALVIILDAMAYAIQVVRVSGSEHVFGHHCLNELMAPGVMTVCIAHDFNSMLAEIMGNHSLL